MHILDRILSIRRELHKSDTSQHNFSFRHVGAFWCTGWEGKCTEKLQVIDNLACLGYNTDEKLF